MNLIKKLLFVMLVIMLAITFTACEQTKATEEIEVTSAPEVKDDNNSKDSTKVQVVKKTVKKVVKTPTPKKLKLSSKRNKITIKYQGGKKCTYQIKYSRYKSMKKAKTIKTKKKTYTIKNLRYNTRYYIKVRALKNKKYSKWSSKKSIKTKKKKKKLTTKHKAVFIVTYYCTGACCNGNGHRRTASGTYLTPGRSIAVDPRVIPLGKKVYINGRQYIAEDTGGNIKGYRIDICVSSHRECNRRGKHKASVRW